MQKYRKDKRICTFLVVKNEAKLLNVNQQVGVSTGAKISFREQNVYLAEMFKFMLMGVWEMPLWS